MHGLFSLGTLPGNSFTWRANVSLSQPKATRRILNLQVKKIETQKERVPSLGVFIPKFGHKALQKLTSGFALPLECQFATPTSCAQDLLCLVAKNFGNPYHFCIQHLQEKLFTSDYVKMKPLILEKY